MEVLLVEVVRVEVEVLLVQVVRVEVVVLRCKNEPRSIKLNIMKPSLNPEYVRMNIRKHYLLFRAGRLFLAVSAQNFLNLF